MSHKAHLKTATSCLDCSTRQSLSSDGSNSSPVSDTTEVPENGPDARKNLFICEICEISKVTLLELSNHSLTHVGVMPYYCLKCPFVSISLTHLYIHLIKHIEFIDGEADKKRRLKMVWGRMAHVCNLCKLSFNFYDNLITHYLMIHIRMSYKCVQCSFVFFSEADCLIHSHLHDAVVCKVCSKVFDVNPNSGYLTHVLSHDHTKLYRKFPRIYVDFNSIPYYKTFFEICYKISHFNSNPQKSQHTGNQIKDASFPHFNLKLPELGEQFGKNLEEIFKVVLEEENSTFVFNPNCHGSVADQVINKTIIDKQNMCDNSIVAIQRIAEDNIVTNQETFQTDSCALINPPVECHQSTSVNERETGLNTKIANWFSFRKHLPDYERSVSNLAANPVVELEVQSSTAVETNLKNAAIECIDLDKGSNEPMEEDVHIINDSMNSEPAVQFTSNHKQEFLPWNIKPVNAVFPFTLSLRGEKIVSIVQRRDSVNKSSCTLSEDDSNQPSNQNLKDPLIQNLLSKPQFSSTITSMQHSEIPSFMASDREAINRNILNTPLDSQDASMWDCHPSISSFSVAFGDDISSGISTSRSSETSREATVPKDFDMMTEVESVDYLQKDKNDCQTIVKCVQKQICVVNNLLPGVISKETCVNVENITLPPSEIALIKETCEEERTNSTSTSIQVNVDSISLQDTSGPAHSNKDECSLLNGKNLRISLVRLPDEIFSAMTTKVPKSADVQCAVKELKVVLHRLPSHVRDFGSFKKYKRQQRKKRVCNSQTKKVRIVKPFSVKFNRNFKKHYLTPKPDNSLSAESNVCHVESEADLEVSHADVSNNQQNTISQSKGMTSFNGMFCNEDLDRSLQDVYISQEDAIAQSMEMTSSFDSMDHEIENSPTEASLASFNVAFVNDLSSEVTTSIRSSKEREDAVSVDFDMATDVESVGLSIPKHFHVSDDGISYSVDYISIQNEVKALQLRIKGLKGSLKTLKEIQKQLVPNKELRVLLFKLPDYIVETHRKGKPIMLSNLLPVIQDVQSLKD